MPHGGLCAVIQLVQPGQHLGADVGGQLHLQRINTQALLLGACGCGGVWGEGGAGEEGAAGRAAAAAAAAGATRSIVRVLGWGTLSKEYGAMHGEPRGRTAMGIDDTVC